MGLFHFQSGFHFLPIAIHLTNRLGRYSLHLLPLGSVLPASLRRLASAMFITSRIESTGITPACRSGHR